MVLILSFIVPSRLHPLSREYIKFQAAKEDFMKGMKFYNRMQYLAAVEFFRSAVKEYPEYHTARDYLARSYKLAGYVDEALRELENFQEMAPENVMIAGRIDNLKYRDSGGASRSVYSALILNETLDSPQMKGYQFPRPVDIAVDSGKNIYITSFSSGRLVVLEQGGKGVSTFKPEFSSQLHGVDTYKNRIVVTDYKLDTVYLMDSGLKVVKKFGQRGSGEGEFYGPRGACFDDKGNIFIVDSGNSRVQKFDDEGRFILQFGEKGEYEKQFQSPSDVAFMKNRVYVSDPENRKISVYDDSGNFMDNIQFEGLEKPRGISFHEETLLISDESRGLLFYDLEQKSARVFDSWNGKRKKFSRLISSVVDRDGFLYCLDYGYESVMQFSPLQKRYTNIDVEITSVDTEKFPTVAFYVNVRGRDGKPVYNLARENFAVTEDKAAMKNLYVDYLKRLAPSVSMVMCVDRSAENEGSHNDIPWVADFILKKMRKSDTLRLINFNSDAWEANKFDWSRRRTLKALKEKTYAENESGQKKKVYGPGKRIDKALYNAITDLAPRLNRRGVVLVTDGSVDDGSFQQYTPRNIINFARSHYIPVYIVSLKRPDSILETIARETGGALVRPGELTRLGEIYDLIKQSEEYRYVLVYSTFKPQSFKGWWSDVKIDVDYKKQKGVEWGGYFVP